MPKIVGKLLLIQTAVAVILGLIAGLAVSPATALATLAGSGLGMLATLVSAVVTFGGGEVREPGAAFAALVIGELLKFAVVIVGLVIGFSRYPELAMPMLAGVGVTLLAFQLVMRKTSVRDFHARS